MVDGAALAPMPWELDPWHIATGDDRIMTPWHNVAGENHIMNPWPSCNIGPVPGLRGQECDS